MKKLSTNDIRSLFLDYFKGNQHQVIASNSLIPPNDPTLLFTNAGMVQFKDVFLGHDKRSYTRAVSSQRCMRAGGKHNDLENVGYTKRHHTFFEMLGNFSFGDYFKREAIQFAWQFLTETLKLPKEKLWVTVYRDDKESEDIWLNEMGVDPNRFSRCGEKDNFWSMGDTGPCGPCTEIFYDHGPEIEGGPPGSKNEDGDRYVEIWNLVFMQYNRDINGKLSPLPKPCVDTGMGLERIASVLQGVHDNYDIDLFQALLKALSTIVPCKDFAETSMRVIVDHIRACSFLIADGVMPSNEGRGYVLRRIIRRAVRHGYHLGQHEPFFYKMVTPLVSLMGDAYPGLVSAKPMIEEVLQQEEVQFDKTLSKGLKIFDEETKKLKSDIIPGDVVFLLYDTYGFPIDLTADIARERDLAIDVEGYERCMQEQRERSKDSSTFSLNQTQQLVIDGETEFTGYDRLMDEATVTTLLQNHKPVSRLAKGQAGAVVLDKTPFYAESGGQVGDSGELLFQNGCFEVADTKKHGHAYLHYGKVIDGELKVKDKVTAEVGDVRSATMLNHSATHLLHAALRRVLGDHVVQKGSLVDAMRLRFDFTHTKPLSEKQLHEVEQMVNAQIRSDLSSELEVQSIEEAKESGAMALFGEKYAEKVRVISLGEFSKEVCGGTHVERTGQIGCFKIITESAVASGIRRIEAVTGDVAIKWIESVEHQLNSISGLLKVGRDALVDKVAQLLEQNREYGKELQRMHQTMVSQQSDNFIEQAADVNGFKVLAVKIEKANMDTLCNTLDKLKQQLGSCAIVLATTDAEKVHMVAGVSKDCLDYFRAGDLLNQVATQVGGKGGGRPDLARGGGDKPQALPAALDSVVAWVKQRMDK